MIDREINREIDGQIQREIKRERERKERDRERGREAQGRYRDRWFIVNGLCETMNLIMSMVRQRTLWIQIVVW